jgi:methyltransferase (TIGR00027 family)
MTTEVAVDRCAGLFQGRAAPYDVAMQTGQFSRTALGAAAHRAAHQILEGGRIFVDPLAVRILGAEGDALIEEARANPQRRGLRLFIAARARFAEDAVAEAVARGVRQIVVLGAGLDTSSYRARHDESVRMFEVDHPATQAWKRARLGAAGIAIPSALSYVAVDFERERFMDRLDASGFDKSLPAFFIWLGVVPYLTETAIDAALPGGAEVVFDYSNPVSSIDDPDRRAAHEALVARVAAAGEPLITMFETDALARRLESLGLRVVADLGLAGIAERYFGRPGGSDRGGHIMHAARRA